MILYNITCHIEKNTSSQFTKWVSETFLNKLELNDFVLKAHLFELLIDIDDLAKSYSIQIIFDQMPQYLQFQLENEKTFLEEIKKQFEGKIFTFATLLKQV
jgi:Domain of unknown function (DUF4286)